MKKLGVLIAVFALSAIGAANASAASFTSTNAGALSVVSDNPQVFVFNSSYTCTIGTVTGTAVTSGTAQKATAHYNGCTGPLGVVTHVTPAEYDFTADDTGGVENIHIRNTITLTATVPFGTCYIKIHPQTIGTVDYSSASGDLTYNPNVGGIDFTTSGGTDGKGGLCGAPGRNGTYDGNVVVSVANGNATYHH